MFFLAKSFNLTFQNTDSGQFTYLDKKESATGFFLTDSFMNESGKSIKSLLSITKPENFIIVHDYLDSDFTKVKLKEGGSAEYKTIFF